MTQKVIKRVKDNFSEKCILCDNPQYPYSYIRIGFNALCFPCHYLILDKALKEFYWRPLDER